MVVDAELLTADVEAFRRWPEAALSWSLASLREKLIKIGAKVIGHGRYVTCQMAEIAVSRQIFADILMLVAPSGRPPAP